MTYLVYSQKYQVLSHAIEFIKPYFTIIKYQLTLRLFLWKKKKNFSILQECKWNVFQTTF